MLSARRRTSRRGRGWAIAGLFTAGRRCGRAPWLGAALQIRDEAGVDEHAVEMARLSAAGAGVEQALAAREDLLLFEE